MCVGGEGGRDDTSRRVEITLDFAYTYTYLPRGRGMGGWSRNRAGQCLFSPRAGVGGVAVHAVTVTIHAVTV